MYRVGKHRNDSVLVYSSQVHPTYPFPQYFFSVGDCCPYIPAHLAMDSKILSFFCHLLAFENHFCVSVDHFILSAIKIPGYLFSAGALFTFVTNKSLLVRFIVIYKGHHLLL